MAEFSLKKSKQDCRFIPIADMGYGKAIKVGNRKMCKINSHLKKTMFTTFLKMLQHFYKQYRYSIRSKVHHFNLGKTIEQKWRTM
jgi:hypothetical protein